MMSDRSRGRGRGRWALGLALGVGACTQPPTPPSSGSAQGAQAKGPIAAPEPPAPIKFDVGAPALAQRPPPEGFVDVQAVAPGVRLDIRYATAANFTGGPLPGYVPGAAWLREQTGEALAQVQRELESEGLGLLVFDAYRPKRATDAMVRWADNAGRTDLLTQGYIARDSGHNRGNTVDLTLVSLQTGAELEMGTAWDAFSKDSEYGAAKGEAMANRRRLRTAMMAHGFEPYDKEWWHFSRPSESALEVLDEPYGG